MQSYLSKQESALASQQKHIHKISREARLQGYIYGKSTTWWADTEDPSSPPSPANTRSYESTTPMSTIHFKTHEPRHRDIEAISFQPSVSLYCSVLIIHRHDGTLV
jgi:hypothetical protein